MADFVKKLSGRVARAFRPRFVALSLGLSFLLPAIARAGWNPFSLEDLGYNFVGKFFFFISFLISNLFGIVIMVEGFVLQIILTISVSVVNSPVVRVGFPVVLSFANLAFVLGLVVIAISTIVGLQSYGMKNLLWKLLVMAIGVNFGLVICGIILGFSDNVSLFFVNSVVPEGASGLSAFADNFAGAFNPQRSFLLSADNVIHTKEIEEFQKAFSVDNGAGTAQLLKPMIGVLMTIATLLIIVVIMGALILMLFVRYVKLAFSLVVLPLAWAAWPFPSISHYTRDWWNGFLRQVFFLPVAIFALWLGMTVAQEMAKQTNADDVLQLEALSKVGAGAGITGFLGGLMTPILNQFVVVMVIGGVMTMGLVAAQSFGIQFAGAAMNAVKAGQGRIKREVTSRATRTAKRAGLAAKEHAVMPIQRKLLGFGAEARSATIDPLMAAARRKALAIPGVKRVVSIPATLHLNAELTDKSGAPILLDAQRNRVDGAKDANGKWIKDAAGNYLGTDGNTYAAAQAQYDHDKHEWKKDEHGNYIDENNASYEKSHVNIVGGEVIDENGAVLDEMDRKQLDDHGLIKDNKPVTHHVDANSKNYRPMAESTTERMKKRVKDLSEGGKAMKELVAAERALQEEAENSGGVLSGMSGVVFGSGFDAGKAMAQGDGGKGGHGPATPGKKDDHGGKKDDHGGSKH